MLRYRLAYAFALAGAVLFYLFFNGYLALFLLIFAVVFPLVSVLIAFLAGRGVTLDPEPSAPSCNKDVPFALRLRIRNRSFLPLTTARITVCCRNILTGAVQEDTFRLPIPPRADLSMDRMFTSRYCGKMSYTVTGAICYDFLGLVSFRLPAGQEADFFVLPTVHAVSVQSGASSLPGTDSTTFSKYKPGDDPSEIFDIRPYRSGDRPRSIHWKLSSKLDDLMVKEFSLPTDSSLLLMADLTGTDSAAIDTAVETFASLSHDLLEQQIFHTAIYYDADTDSYCEQEISSEEELAYTLNILLSRPGQTEPRALRAFRTLMEITQKKPRIVYITSSLFLEEASSLAGEATGITVLHTAAAEAVPDLSGSENFRVIPVAPGKMEASLSGLTL